MINNQTKNALHDIFTSEKITYNCPLKDYTSFKIGGCAEALVTVDKRGQLNRLLNLLNNERLPFFVIGKGTNLLINDKGYRGIVVKLGDEFKELTIDRNYIMAGAALLMSRMVMIAAKNNLGGIEHLAVIPGTVGGGITQNAGSSNKEIKSNIVSVEVLNTDKGINTLVKDELNMSYRSSIFKNKANGKYIIMSSRLSLEPREFLSIRQEIKEKYVARKNKMPLNFANAGSVFRRPVSGDPPGKIIEESGCKGLSVGDAEVSRMHANVIINKGNATFDDVVKLVDIVRNRVLSTAGISLELEIEIIK
jgi:UDP-N-acetylmuramate dehydrogenase